MGAFLTLFVSLMSLQGVNAAVTDGVAIRAAKYVTSNFIPVIGRMFTDATDTVLSASILLKNSNRDCRCHHHLVDYFISCH